MKLTWRTQGDFKRKALRNAHIIHCVGGRRERGGGGGELETRNSWKRNMTIGLVQFLRGKLETELTGKPKLIIRRQNT